MFGIFLQPLLREYCSLMSILYSCIPYGNLFHDFNSNSYFNVITAIHFRKVTYYSYFYLYIYHPRYLQTPTFYWACPISIFYVFESTVRLSPNIQITRGICAWSRIRKGSGLWCVYVLALIYGSFLTIHNLWHVWSFQSSWCSNFRYSLCSVSIRISNIRVSLVGSECSLWEQKHENRSTKTEARIQHWIYEISWTAVLCTVCDYTSLYNPFCHLDYYCCHIWHHSCVHSCFCLVSGLWQLELVE